MVFAQVWTATCNECVACRPVSDERQRHTNRDLAVASSRKRRAGLRNFKRLFGFRWANVCRPTGSRAEQRQCPKRARDEGRKAGAIRAMRCHASCPRASAKPHNECEWRSWRAGRSKPRSGSGFCEYGFEPTRFNGDCGQCNPNPVAEPISEPSGSNNQRAPLVVDRDDPICRVSSGRLREHRERQHSNRRDTAGDGRNGQYHKLARRGERLGNGRQHCIRIPGIRREAGGELARPKLESEFERRSAYERRRKLDRLYTGIFTIHICYAG